MKLTLRFLFFLLFSCFYFTSSGQQVSKTDSLLLLLEHAEVDTLKARLYLALGDTYKLTNPLKNNEYANLAYKIYKKHNDQKGLAEVFYAKYYYSYVVGNIDSAYHYLDKSISKSLLLKDSITAASREFNKVYKYYTSGNPEEAENLIKKLTPVFLKYEDSIMLARTYILKGMIANSKGYANLGLEEYLKSLKISRQLNEKLQIAEALFGIGHIYLETKDYQKSIGYFLENLAIGEQINLPQSVAQSSNFIGFAYLELGQYKEAKEYFDKSLGKSEEVGFQYNIGKTQSHLGQLKLKQDKYEDAFQHFLKAYDIFKMMNILPEQAVVVYYLGKLHLDKKEFSAAISKFDEAIEIGKKTKEADVLKDSYLQKSLALEKLGDSKGALEYFKKNKVLNDSIFTAKNSQKTKELQIMFETERKEQQIAQQKVEINLLEEQEKLSRLQKIALGGGLGISLIALGFGFYGFRQRNKRNRLEKEKIETELAFKKKELTTHALHLAKKNEVLEQVKQKVKELKLVENIEKGYQTLVQTINFDQQDDKAWDSFTQYFEAVHKDFAKQAVAKYPDISKSELRLIALIKMNLSSKEIANILNISSDGIKKARQRLRKKMNLSPEESLEATVMAI